jgi:hypothetical protein
MEEPVPVRTVSQVYPDEDIPSATDRIARLTRTFEEWTVSDS